MGSSFQIVDKVKETLLKEVETADAGYLNELKDFCRDLHSKIIDRKTELNQAKSNNATGIN